MIEVESLQLQLNGRSVLQQINLRAQPGEITVLLGPNGSGKTTLLLCLCAHYRAAQDHIRLCRQPLSSLSYRSLARLLAMVPQDHNPVFPYQVREVILLGRISRVGFWSQPTAQDYEVVENILNILKIQHLADKPYTRISGGERQLVLIGRCLAQEPQVLLLDEPTNHLDFKNQYSILQLIAELARRQQLTVLLTLHDPNMALLFADYVVLLSQGRIAAQGNPRAIITPENMAQIYQLEVEMITEGDRRLLYPKFM
ncbi:MAG: ABC transporter ATP-binding protein [Desulfobacca sp.]|nr:ABC transporter ATP-binding protein [Desulfobacca sp.]